MALTILFLPFKPPPQYINKYNFISPGFICFGQMSFRLARALGRFISRDSTCVFDGGKLVPYETGRSASPHTGVVGLNHSKVRIVKV